MTDAPSSAVRFVDGRRMQCKDIPDSTFIAAVLATPGVNGSTQPDAWRMRWNVQAELERRLGTIPDNLFLAKSRKLMDAGKLDGCPCGCRGDFHVPDRKDEQRP